MKRDFIKALTDRQREVIHTVNKQHDDGVIRVVCGETKALKPESEDTIRAVLSSETKDRYDDIIRAQAFNTPTNFKNYFDSNPVLCWAHNRDSSVPTRPIGKIANPIFDGRDINGCLAFEGDVIFDMNYEFAAEVCKSYKSGFLSAFSCGFRPVTVKVDSTECDGYEFLEVDLLENSAVPIPANPAAIKKAFTSGTVSEEFLQRTFFKMRDEILVRNSDIFLPRNWKFGESLNELASLAKAIETGEIKKETKAPAVKKEDTYKCESCEKDLAINLDDYPEKEYVGVKYRNVTCSNCQATTEECLAAMELIESCN